MHGRVLIGLLGVFASLSSAIPSPFQSLAAVAKRQTQDYLQTDYYTTWPKGVPKKYTFYVSKQKASPDGQEREVLAVTTDDPALGPVKATVPGPAIEASWGDTIEVEVINRLGDKGTGIHFHGVRQYHSNHMDGTPSITQCPIAPSNSTTYTWTATQYGTSWYHSHFGAQAWDGIFGPIVIKHPDANEADIDVGPIMLSDWVHSTMEEHYKEHSSLFGTNLDNILINGENTLPGDASKGKRHTINFQTGKTHRLRLVNSAMDTTFRVSIDGHDMQVIATDFVPITPYTTNSLTITMGQRYDIIVNASKEAKDYWFRAEPVGNPCAGSSTHDHPENGLAIVRYDAASTAIPETESSVGPIVNCEDEEPKNLAPALEENVDLNLLGKSKVITWSFFYDDDQQRSFWRLNTGNDSTTAAFFSDWRYPTLNQYVENEVNHVQETHAIKVDESDGWLKMVITNNDGRAHPIHLHGHDFYILEQSSKAYDATQENLNASNPPRRDVANLSPDGYLVLAMKIDNPGAWLMHCHIGFHAAQGMNIQILETMQKAVDQIPSGDKDKMKETCDNWTRFQDATKLDQNAEWEAGP